LPFLLGISFVIFVTFFVVLGEAMAGAMDSGTSTSTNIKERAIALIGRLHFSNADPTRSENR
jgi:hypothetical protein